MDKGSLLRYKAEKSQFSFLQLLSDSASQTIIYHCKNSLAYLDSNNSVEKALKFLTYNEKVVSAYTRNNGYSVNLDECQQRSSSWAKTVFEFNTDDTLRLPIEDVSPSDIGHPSQAFGLEIGPVCFQ